MTARAGGSVKRLNESRTAYLVGYLSGVLGTPNNWTGVHGYWLKGRKCMARELATELGLRNEVAAAIRDSRRLFRGSSK